MTFYCFKCSTSLILTTGGKAARAEECPSCHADMHCCYNCVHYDRSAYNQCHEPQAERVVDKDRRNFCDYFRFAADRKSGSAVEAAASTKKKLDDLFK